MTAVEEMKEAMDARVAPHGQKMVEVTIRFWTDEIAPNDGEIWPKHVWSSGVARVTANEAHGITSENPVPFNSLVGIGKVIEDLLIEHGIVVHPHKLRMSKYVGPGWDEQQTIRETMRREEAASTDA